MTTRNMNEKDDYIIDNDNRVRFRKSTNLNQIMNILVCLLYHVSAE